MQSNGNKIAHGRWVECVYVMWATPIWLHSSYGVDGDISFVPLISIYYDVIDSIYCYVPYHCYYYFADDIVMHEMFVPDLDSVTMIWAAVTIARPLNADIVVGVTFVAYNVVVVDAPNADVVT